MKNIETETRLALNKIINHLSDERHLYVKNPQKDFTRNRKTSLPDIIKASLSMNSGTLNKDLLRYYDYSIDVISSAGYLQQLDKITIDMFKKLFRDYTSTIKALKTYKGYRLLAVDGSTINISDKCDNDKTKLSTSRKRIKYKSPYYNAVHMNALYDILNSHYVDLELYPGQNNELTSFNNMIDNNQLSNAIVIADRGYESLNCIAHCIENKVKFVLRIKNNIHGLLRKFNSLDEEFDFTHHYILTRSKTNEVKNNRDKYQIIQKATTFDYLPLRSRKYEQSFYEMDVRFVRFRLPDGKYECLATNLDANEFSVEELSQLYFKRWGIETSYRELKYNLGVSCLHHKKYERIIKELYSKCIMFNFCMAIINSIEIKKNKTKYAYKINISDAVEICKASFRRNGLLYIEEILKKYLIPIRPNRQYGRYLQPKDFVKWQYRIAA